MQTNEHEHVVRKFAHQIWESEGKPDGQAERHWEMACKLAAGEVGPADPFEPLTNINNFVPSADQETKQVSASMPETEKKRSRSKSKVIDDNAVAAPKKRVSRAKKDQQVS